MRYGRNFHNQLSGEKKLSREIIRDFAFVLFAISFFSALWLMAYDNVEIPLQFPPYKILPDFPPLFWIATIAFAFGLAIYASSNSDHSNNRKYFLDFIVCVLAVVVLYGCLPLSESSVRWHDNWLHSSIARYIIEQSSLDPSTIGYHSWPGFFIWLAQLSMVTGVDPTVLSKSIHMFFNILLVLILYLLYQKLAPKNLGGKFALVGTVLFLIANDRLYYHSCPQNFVFPLFITFYYVVLTMREKGRALLFSLVLFFAMIISHPITPLFILAPMLVLAVVLRIFSVPKGDPSRFSSLFLAGLCVWVGWAVYVVNTLWWRYGINSIIGVEERITGELPLFAYSPTYWRWAPPPIEIATLRMIIIAFALITAFLGVVYMIKRFNLVSLKKPWIKTVLTQDAWSLLAFSAIAIGVIVAGAFPLIFYMQIMGFADRFLLFIWMPVIFFATIFIMKLRNRKVKTAVIIIAMLLFIPAVINTHWHEFWLSTYCWEENGLMFARNSFNFSSVILSDSGSAHTLRGMVGFDTPLNVLNEGSKASPREALLIFNGSLPPQSLNWTYFIRSEKAEVRLNMYFNINPEKVHNLDLELTNSLLINRIYDSDHFQIYYRVGNTTE